MLSATAVTYSPLLEAEVAKLEQMLAGLPGVKERFPTRWLAIQLLEGDESLLEAVGEGEQGMLASAVAASHQRLQAQYDENVDLAITDERYQFVHGLVNQVLTAPSHRLSPSDRIDRITTHRWLGIPIFLRTNVPGL